MKRFFHWFLLHLFRFAIKLRYRVTVTGLDHVVKELDGHKGGILFLPNHSSVFIDPSIVTTTILTKVNVRPVIVEYMYYTAGVNTIMKMLRAVCIPNFGMSSNSHKLRKMDRALDEVINGLEKGENFIFYPAGKVKLTPDEKIGGSSGLSKVMSETQDLKVVLIRTTGLWGSKFSKFQGNVNMGKTFFWGIKRTFKNLLFFNPKRDVTIEFETLPKDFPHKASKKIQNRYLEDWYNRYNGFKEEPITLYPHSAWSKELPEVVDMKKKEEAMIHLEKISPQVKEKVLKKLSEISDQPLSEIHPDNELAVDLGIDSLDVSEISYFLEEEFEVKGVSSEELSTVKRVLGFASGQLQYEGEEEEKLDLKHWNQPVSKVRHYLPDGGTIPELFLTSCAENTSRAAAADMRSGVLSYSDMKMRAILLGEYFAKLPGEHIGILLPSSVAASLCIMACYMAKKIPVMINWTVGARHVNAVIECSNIKHAISSRAFLDRLPNVDLGNLEDMILELEELRFELGLFDKLSALIKSKYSTKTLMRKLGLRQTKPSDTAVVLFTSGSEGMPKGVPLTHKNVLSNIHSLTQIVPIFSNDVFYGILPPFHSFGYTICCITPLLSGLRVAFHPNPTEGTKLAEGIDEWKVTILTGAPTFLKKILLSATKEQLQSLRLLVTGAEKAPEELYSLAEKKGVGGIMTEGYGITECSPVLTMNHIGEKPKGVGKPVPHVSLLIVDPETYEPLPNNTRGLVLATGPNVFSGYLNNPQDPFIEKFNKKWYITRDLGSIDDEGFLTLSGRQKRFIKIGPEMISLQAIEEALMEQASSKGWPEHEEGPILGICAEEVPGDKPKIFLFTTFPLTSEAANQALRDSGISNLVRISETFQLPEIPIMGTGKVNYRVLEEEFLRR